MDVIELFKAALFGLVEGVTEWLPISSTGHMLLLDEFVTLDVSEDFWNMFLVVIQLGAILAVCLLYFGRLNPFSGKKTAEEKRDTWVLWAKIVVACIPAAVVGIPLDDWMEEHLSSPYIIAAALIVYGVIFIVLETWRANHAAQKTRARHMAEELPETALDVSWPQAIGIGMFQILSLVPGTSRSGSTIIGGLALGCSRPAVTEFTFFLAIPVMFGASALRLVKFFLGGGTFTMTEAALLGVGCVVAFVVSILVIKLLMGYVRKHDFRPFGWYRIVLGIAVIVYFAFIAG